MGMYGSREVVGWARGEELEFRWLYEKMCRMQLY